MRRRGRRLVAEEPTTLVDIDDGERALQIIPGCLDLRRSLGSRDQQGRAREPHTPSQFVARNGRLDRRNDEAGLERPEHDGRPGRRLPGGGEEDGARLEAVGAKQPGPARCFPRHVGERVAGDDAFAVDERERAAIPVARERLDDVAREIELDRNVPDGRACG